jgi:outer membrane protein assembly factor BamB
MIYCFDLDGTLCTNTEGDYEKASPFTERIEVVNKLYSEGNTILIDTARGATTKIDWYDITKKQLEMWGVKYTNLRVGIKLNADIFIDDKGINDKLFFI